jgi:hypothetical protein
LQVKTGNEGIPADLELIVRVSNGKLPSVFSPKEFLPWIALLIAYARRRIFPE